LKGHRASRSREIEALAGPVVDRLREGKRVRRTVPGGGRLHIDRKLPFLAAYRRPATRSDPGTRRLVLGEAAYLVAPGGAGARAGVERLTRSVVETVAPDFGAFLLLELWAGPDEVGEDGDAPPPPGFRIRIPRSGAPARTVETLARLLRKVALHGRRAEVKTMRNVSPAPSGRAPLLDEGVRVASGAVLLGLEIRPVYRAPGGGEAYPLDLNQLRRGLSRALKHAFYEFARRETRHRPRSVYAVGRRATVKAVREVDRDLAAVSDAIDFLLWVTPVNTDEAWTAFRRARFVQAPELVYRPLPVDPARLKRELWSVPVERVEDPVLADLFLEKRAELDRRLTMLQDRNTPAFRLGSLQLHGEPPPEVEAAARQLLDRIPAGARERNARKISAAAFAERARREVEHYRERHPDLATTVELRDDVVGLLVSRGRLFVGRSARFPQGRVEALLHHEVGTHVLTWANGCAQRFRQLQNGLPGYERLQEGLAVLAEYLAGGLSRPRLRLLAARVVGVRTMVEGADFVETFRVLTEELGMTRRTAFGVTVRIHRSGGLAKDAIYLEGLVQLLDYLREGGRLELLYLGKFGLDHVSMIEELLERHLVRPPVLLPRYLEDPDEPARLEWILRADSILDLLPRRKGSR